MKAAFKQGRTITLRDVTLPALQPDQIRVKIAACGICGTDLHLNSSEPAQEQGFGHEMAGTIIEKGGGVLNLEVGQKVVIESSSPCGFCEHCKNAQQELCTDIQSFFHLGHFGFAEEIIAPAITAIPCDDLPADVACLSEPLGVAIDLVRLAEISLSSNVLILGPGPIGLMALSIVKKMGARRVFLSAHKRSAARIAVAEKIGVDGIFDPSETPLSQVDFGCQIDRILVTTPPPTLTEAFEVACKGGIISFIGISYGDDAYCKFDVNAFHFKKLQLRASFASPALYTPLALQYLREGVVDGEALISHRFPLDRISEAMETARDTSRAVKVIVQP
ncbi:MAG: zinc-dependent alcohol dehydrogenase [Armatimonadota bacterium]